MIQNADDAGAKIVRFYVDCRQHDTKYLKIKELALYQGPALIVANDAKFSEQDWEGIQNLQRSVKAGDPFKAGHFGIGFNSVYHLTGTNSIIAELLPRVSHFYKICCDIRSTYNLHRKLYSRMYCVQDIQYSPCMLKTK